MSHIFNVRANVHFYDVNNVKSLSYWNKKYVLEKCDFNRMSCSEYML